MSKTTFKLYTPFDQLTTIQLDEVAGFLHAHLDQYGDAINDIKKALAYAQKDAASHGGSVLVARNENEKIVGAVVINKTGMSGYIPENILVYIAVHEEMRGKGLGKKLMQHIIKVTDGDIALHVEPDNPAKFLYEKLGFENKYLEMRLKKSQSNGANFTRSTANQL
ncbi:MAG: GNAT family N-acetyltransferase [Saprospiraceae bacterium]|nr:GNAT family N-acetyltransferase [Saprospiraceae bacterium]